MSQEKELSPLIRTKLHRPRVTGDLIERTRLLERLEARRHRPLTLVSAPAGYGKTTLVGQWLDQAPSQAAWLSLDESDNERINFLSYFIAAIQTLFPEGCSTTQNLLTASQIPPLDYLITTLINEITDLPEEFLLVLDDYHLITHKEVHQLISAFAAAARRPRCTWSLPPEKTLPFPLSRLRATQTMTEIRMNDLRFTPVEVQSYLKLCLGAEVSPEIVTVLVERTEGWAVGLRLACLSLRDQDDYGRFPGDFSGNSPVHHGISG